MDTNYDFLFNFFFLIYFLFFIFLICHRQIWKDETNLFQDETLIALSLAINTQYGFLACVHPDCGYKLTDKWANHCLNYHKRKVVQEETLHVNHKLAEHPAQAIPLNPPPVAGLRLHKGMRCLRCSPDSKRNLPKKKEGKFALPSLFEKKTASTSLS